MEKIKVSKLLVDRGFNVNFCHLSHVDGRCKGQSLGLAFSFIGEALRNPNKDVFVKDHSNAPRADINLLNLVKKVVVDNKLDYFTFDEVNCSIRFDLPYVTYEKQWIKLYES